LGVIIHKTGDDQSKIEKGIKIKNENKIRIAGAVLRITLIPKKYGHDFKLSIWLPNGKQVEVSDEQGYVQWQEFMKGLVEATTGEKPKDGTEKKTIDINGIPVRIVEREDDKTDTIIVTIDPLIEVYKIAKKEEVKKETPAVTSITPKILSLPEKIKTEMTDKTKTQIQTSKQAENESIQDWLDRMQSEQGVGVW